MNKKKKKNIIIGIVLILIFGIILSSQGFLNLPFATGSSILSLSQVDLQSYNNYLNGKVWLLTFVSGGLGQSYYGFFDNTKIQDGSSYAQKDFSIDIDYSDTTCNYAIYNSASNIPIYDIQKVEWTYIPYVNPCTQSEASERGLSNVLIYGKYTNSVTCFAIGYNSKSLVGNIQNPNVGSQFTVTLDVGGNTASKTFDTLSGTRQGNIGDFAYGIWQGNLVSGQSCPSQSTYKTAYVNGIWRVIDNQNYQRYISSYDNLVNYYGGSLSTSEGEINNLVTDIQSKSSIAKGSKTFGTITSSSSLNNAVIKLTTQTPIQFPLTSLYIKADTLGIYTPVPNMKIIDTNSDCFKTGSGNGLISIEIRNDGDERGTFNAYAQCDSPFTQTSSVTGTLESGQSRIINLPLSASASEKTTGTCIVYIESTGETKSKSVGVCVDPLITCTPNDKFCAISNGIDVVKQCSGDGATAQLIKTCGIDEYCENAECKSGSSPQNWFQRLISSIKIFFNELFSGTFNLIKILKISLSVIVFIFAFLFGKDLFSGLQKGKNEWLSWILALIGGFLISWVVYLAFWWGMLIFVIWVLFRLIVGGKLLRLKRGIKKLRK